MVDDRAMTDASTSNTDALGATCLIALDQADEILPGLLHRTFAQIAPRSSIVIEEAEDGHSTQALSIEIDGHRIGAAVFDQPMPSPDWEIAARHSVFWSEARQYLSTHKGFVALGALGKQTSLGLARAQAVAVTRLAAALAETMPTQGVYWRGAEVCTAPEKIVRAVGQIDRGKWPLDVWMGWTHFFDEGDDRDVFGLQTRGAAAYLGYELEIPPAPVRDTQEPLRVLLNAAGFLIDRGDVVRDGQLIEVSGERRFVFNRHEGLDGSARVATLTLPGTDLTAKGTAQPQIEPDETTENASPDPDASDDRRHAIP